MNAAKTGRKRIVNRSPKSGAAQVVAYSDGSMQVRGRLARNYQAMCDTLGLDPQKLFRDALNREIARRRALAAGKEVSS